MRENLRQRALWMARKVGILPMLERVRFHHKCKLSHADNTAFLASNPGFAVPPQWWMHDMYSHTNYRLYVESGRSHAGEVIEIFQRHLGCAEIKIADFGCGLARVLRHLPTCHECHGFDVNDDAITWCRDTFPEMAFTCHGSLPPLPVAERHFDFVFGISVLTHLSIPAAEAWMIEIARVLRPGGIFLCTVHGAKQTASLIEEERRGFDAGKPVIRSHVQEGSRLYTAYHPEAFLREHLFAGFEIVSGPEQRFNQEAWVLRVPHEESRLD